MLGFKNHKFLKETVSLKDHSNWVNPVNLKRWTKYLKKSCGDSLLIIIFLLWTKSIVYSLKRRDHQYLCKNNNILANLTNDSTVDALASYLQLKPEEFMNFWKSQKFMPRDHYFILICFLKIYSIIIIISFERVISN